MARTENRDHDPGPSSLSHEPAERSSSTTLAGVLSASLVRRVGDLGAALTAFFIIVIVVASGSAIALLTWPAQSGSYFSWDLGAPSVAATIGGLYLASVATFGTALLRPRSQVRSLTIGGLALALPTLWFTLTHWSVFDWRRPQAIAWVILFLCALVLISRDLRTPAGPDRSPSAGRGTRATLVVIALVGAVGAGVLWSEPVAARVAAHSPIPIIGLAGRYLGAWCAFLAATAASAAVRGRTTDARLTAALLGTASFGLLAAAARIAGDLGPNAKAYVAVVTAIGAVAVVLHRTNPGTDALRSVAVERSEVATSAPAANERIRS